MNDAKFPLSDIKIVSWDVDGTLYRSDLFKQALLRAWLRHCWRPSTWRDISAILDSQKMIASVHESNGECQGLFDAAIRQRAASAERRWFGNALQAIGLRDGVLDTMLKLKDYSVTQVVVSDYDANDKLACLGVSSLIDKQYSGEALGALKPSSHMFKTLCESYAVEPHEILHIGDRQDTDGVAATRAGCYFHLAPPVAKLNFQRIFSV